MASLELKDTDIANAAQALEAEFFGKPGQLKAEISKADFCKAWPTVKVVLEFIPSLPVVGAVAGLVIKSVVQIVDRWSASHCKA